LIPAFLKKLSKSILIALVVSGFVLPHAALAASSLKSGDPCGMVICCCPTMCKMVKKRAPVCHLSGPVDCGIKSKTASPDGIAPYAHEHTRIALTLAPPAYPAPDLWISLRTQPIDMYSAERSPLDRPPSVL
jgi:hypothetical protein